MPVAKKMSYFLVSYACAFLLAYIVPEHIDRRDFARVVDVYSHSQTPENMAALEAQRHENERVHLRDSSVVAVVLVAVGYGIRDAYILITEPHEPASMSCSDASLI